MRGPRWTWWTLLTGAVLLVAWGWWVLGFLGEPSAVGGVWAALVLIGAGSIVIAALGVIAAAALLARKPWAWTVAFVASVFMSLTVVGAIAGVPALVGVIAGRRLS
jgi:hypothetical protein